MGDGFSRGPYRPNRAIGDMAVVAPDASAPRVSDAAWAAAEALLAEPEMMRRQIMEQMNKMKSQMLAMEQTLNQLVHVVQERQRLQASDPSARNYFLNEQHTTHVSKAQVRRERREAKKREAESKAPRPSGKARKSRTGRSHGR